MTHFKNSTLVHRLIPVLCSVLLLSAVSADAKQLVLFFDGTGNSECDFVDEAGETTNIFRMFTLAQEDDEQLTFYRRGIGSFPRGSVLPGAEQVSLTSSAGEAVNCQLENAVQASDIEVRGKLRFRTGHGMALNVQLGLSFVRENWQEGDRIFIFGFSRGAATAQNLVKRLDQQSIPVHFLGLYDMVYSKLIDIERLTIRRLASNAFVSLPDNVDSALHLLALDESRRYFPATRWNFFGADQEQRARMSEVWFAGTHADIGGGLRLRTLADISLAYMMQKSEEKGLRFLSEDEVSLPRAITYLESLRTVSTKLSNAQTWPQDESYGQRIFLNAEPQVLRPFATSGRWGNLRFRYQTSPQTVFHPSVELIYGLNQGHAYCNLEGDRTGSDEMECSGVFPSRVMELIDQEVARAESSPEEASLLSCVQDDVVFPLSVSPGLCTAMP